MTCLTLAEMNLKWAVLARDGSGKDSFYQAAGRVNRHVGREGDERVDLVCRR